MKFKNRPNELITVKDGSGVKHFWNSRSVAVAACIVHLDDNFDNPRVLMVKRGPESSDFKDHWCLPCGYLDWDETFSAAIFREVWEETGIDCGTDFNTSSTSIIYPLYDDGKNPWMVNSDPTANHQNVTLYYGVVCCGEVPETKILNPGEISDIKWIPLDKILRLKVSGYPTEEIGFDPAMPICFNHERRINDFYKKIVVEKIVEHKTAKIKYDLRNLY